MLDSAYSRLTRISIAAFLAFAAGVTLGILGFLHTSGASALPMAAGYGAAVGSLLYVASRHSIRWAEYPVIFCIYGLFVAALITWATGSGLERGTGPSTMVLVALSIAGGLHEVERYTTTDSVDQRATELDKTDT